MGTFFESYILSFLSIVNKNNDTIELNFVTIDVNLECHQLHTCAFIKEILTKVFHDLGGKYYKNTQSKELAVLSIDQESA